VPYTLIFGVLLAQLLTGLYAGRDRYLEDERKAPLSG
jgi:CP family cyanate transporter-like MFS transporter